MRDNRSNIHGCLLTLMGCGMIPRNIGNSNWANNFDPNPNKTLSHMRYFLLFNKNLSALLNPGIWASCVRLQVLGICLWPLYILYISGCMQGLQSNSNWLEFLKNFRPMVEHSLGPLFQKWHSGAVSDLFSFSVTFHFF